MTSTSETGHDKNVANLEDIISQKPPLLQAHCQATQGKRCIQSLSKSLQFLTHSRQEQRQKKKKSFPFCKNLNADTHSTTDKNSLTVDSEI